MRSWAPAVEDGPKIEVMGTLAVEDEPVESAGGRMGPRPWEAAPRTKREYFVTLSTPYMWQLFAFLV